MLAGPEGFETLKNRQEEIIWQLKSEALWLFLDTLGNLRSASIMDIELEVRGNVPQRGVESSIRD